MEEEGRDLTMAAEDTKEIETEKKTNEYCRRQNSNQSNNRN